MTTPNQTRPLPESIQKGDSVTPDLDETLTQVLRQKLAERLQAMNPVGKPLHPPKPAQPATPSAPSGTPMPKTAFSSWPGAFSADYVQGRLDALRQALQINTETSETDPVDALTHQSIRENLHLASETLANLLLRQGQQQKAMEVYERLILIFPEKTAFFAAQIEMIKKNLEP